MSLRSLESAITSEARRHFNNSKLRVKDLQEWSTASIKPRAGEVTAWLPLNRVYVAIKMEHDKRPPTAGVPAALDPHPPSRKCGCAECAPSFAADPDGVQVPVLPTTAERLRDAAKFLRDEVAGNQPRRAMQYVADELDAIADGVKGLGDDR